MEKKIEQYDVVIIGGGAAGLTAAIYCGRARLKTLVIEKALVGGLATYTNEIENYPGFPEGSTGLGLMDLFHKQAKKFGVKFKLTDVRGVQLEGDVKTVETFRTNYQCKSVIVASGGKPRLTGAPNEDKFLYDKGISFCATCDAAANTDKTVIVIGSGDAAIEEGMFLTKFASKVIVSVMHEEGKMDCNEIAKEEALANPKMEFIWNTTVAEFRGDDEHLRSVALKDTRTGEIMDVPADTCFLFIGYVPNTEIFKGILDMTRPGYVITNEKMETNIPGVFACGNVLHVHDLVDFVSEEAAAAGKNAARYVLEAADMDSAEKEVPIVPTGGVRYTVPSHIRIDKMEEQLKVRFRVGAVYSGCYVSVYLDEERIIHRKRPVMAPGEMEEILLKRQQLQEHEGLAQITVKIEEA